MALPVIQAISAGIGAVNAVNTVSSWVRGGNGATQVAAAPAGAAASAGNQATAADQGDRFLKLLVAQMRNQDPLNPLDNAQVTTQMAQISTVTGIEKLDGSIGGLRQSLLAAQSLQSAGVIGRQVLAAGATLSLGASGGSAALELPAAADRVQVSIATPAGAVLRRLELGALPGGISTFQWDGMTDAGGRAPSGSYVFQVTASDGNRAVAAMPLSAGRVGGVSLSNGAVQLNLDGGGDLNVADVRRIL
jgi:flagellar basal-body rod modification protein FlgD